MDMIEQKANVAQYNPTIDVMILLPALPLWLFM